MDSPALSRAPLTLKKAKALHRKRKGDEPPEGERRRLDRSVELDRRAEELREQEERRKWAQKKKLERERKEAQARDQLGIGVATQLAGYSHATKSMKNAMEAFLGVKKKNDAKKEPVAKPVPVLEPVKEAEEVDAGHISDRSPPAEEQVLQSAAPVAKKEPWDDLDDELLLGVSPTLEKTEQPETPRKTKSDNVLDKGNLLDPWDGDDLDDEALLYMIIKHSPSRSRKISKIATPCSRPSSKSIPDTAPDAKFNLQIQANSNPRTISPARPISILMPPSGICWDEFLESNTQISVQLDGSPTLTQIHHTDGFPLLLTQDLDFSTQDSVELGLSGELAVQPQASASANKSICVEKEAQNPHTERSVSKPRLDKGQSLMPPPPVINTHKEVYKLNLNDRNLMPPPPLPRSTTTKAMTTNPVATYFDPQPLPSKPSDTRTFHDFGFCTQDLQQLLNDDIFSDDDPKLAKTNGEQSDNAAALSFGSLDLDEFDEFG